MKYNKKAQISLPFHWIYVLIAGVAILIFFGGIIANQKSSSEKSLASTVVTKLDNIFTGAALSEQTVNVVELPEINLNFVCDETGYSAYSVGDSGSAVEQPYTPMFAPKSVETDKIITWTLDFSMPFHVSNLLMVGSDSVDYIILQDRDTTGQSAAALLNDIDETLPDQFNKKTLNLAQLSSYEPLNDYIQIITTYSNPESLQLSPSIADLPDENVVAVKVTSDGEKVTYYIKKGNKFSLNGNPDLADCSKQSPIACIVKDFSTRDAGFYAALFSYDADAYRCGMSKAMARAAMLAEIYNKRTQKIIAEYRLILNDCKTVPTQPAPDGSTIFSRLAEDSNECSKNMDAQCITDVYSDAEAIKQDNTDMRNANCAELY